MTCRWRPTWWIDSSIPAAPDQAWAADITSIRADRAWLYLAAGWSCIRPAQGAVSVPA
jgi:hypothetical protein